MDVPPRRAWVDPYPTGHLFYAPVAPEKTEVRVEATDRFGRGYEATLRTAGTASRVGGQYTRAHVP